MAATLGSSPSDLLSNLIPKSFKLKTKQQELLIRVSILCLVYILAFITRLFSVLRYESMIHEFDPYFNYRTTLYLTEKGFYDFWNWFDSESWYPTWPNHRWDPLPGSHGHGRHHLLGPPVPPVHRSHPGTALIAICPGYISRSVAGSYDNEGVAIFALLLTFYLFVKAVNTGSLAWSLASGIWFVGFQHVQSGEHMAAMGVFFLMQVFYLLDWVKYMLSDTKLFQAFLRITVGSAAGVGAVALGLGMASGYISPWTGRFYSLLDPTYAKDHIPIIASVSEHQPTAWSSFMFDFHILLFLFPAGLYFCFKRLSDATIFIVMYGLTSMYFAGVMVRSKGKTTTTGSTRGTSGSKASSRALPDQSQPFQKNGAIALLVCAFFLLSKYVTHCTWVTSEAYSSPSIVLAARGAHGNRVIFDDYREAYFWLRQNTPPDAKVMSWWDYGYQITAMGNRTVIVDNNTWNNTHIATVGRAMSSYEDEAYEIMRSLDVGYVLVVFGGVTGYSSDDINKFLWMVRIGGGIFPVIKEPDYLVNGEYRVDKGAAPKMLNCLMYKLSYYRFGELVTEYGKPPGYDRARGVEIGNKDVKLEYLEEAFTTSNWIVRIYKVKPPNNRW
ncbi:hypothetical protein Patl1_19322 [Pistacia atlantica]|uniref:Uncharacterized protein n=1 Tax=Pistacia atlantica TaxID=434234 RepID=A0ACC1BZ01_9ROSI|nr:hypothetical protein Patl1_19322 [Pistacia atlantica]